MWSLRAGLEGSPVISDGERREESSWEDAEESLQQEEVEALHQEDEGEEEEVAHEYPA